MLAAEHSTARESDTQWGTRPGSRAGDVARGGAYIVGSSHSLAVDAKRENILEMKRCRDEWGVYPIRPSTFV